MPQSQFAILSCAHHTYLQMSSPGQLQAGEAQGWRRQNPVVSIPLPCCWLLLFGLRHAVLCTLDTGKHWKPEVAKRSIQ
jgi:hypothetical protein